MTVRIVDIETTGTDAAVDAVIEVASVDVQKDGTITNRQEVLVCPPIPVPPEASAVHHLLYQDLTGKPPLKEVLAFFQGADADEALWACTYRCALRAADLARLCGAERSMLDRQIRRCDFELVRTRPGEAEPKAGVLGELKDGRGRRRDLATSWCSASCSRR